ncbi:hypothetical protein MTO96_045091 [Rhipicephalus appendiculatus]
MRKPLSVEKRVAVGLYSLCSNAEDRTTAHLFGIGRSTVNIVYRDFCRAVVSKLEDAWVHMPRKEEMADHMRECYAVTGFPQAIGALDGCHFAVSPPKKDAVDYYNYKGWYNIILLALVDHLYRFRYLHVGSPGVLPCVGVCALLLSVLGAGDVEGESPGVVPCGGTDGGWASVCSFGGSFCSGCPCSMLCMS